MSRRLFTRLAGLLAMAATLLSPAVLADRLAVVDARVHTLATAGVLEGATVLIENGRIMAVGVDLAVPEGYAVIDGAGRDLTPGLFVGYSTIGLAEVNGVDESNDRRVDPEELRGEAETLGAAFSVARAVNAESVLYGVARAGGVLHAMTGPLPGAQVFAGQASVIRLDGPRQTLVAPDAAMIAAVGVAGARISGGSRAAALVRLEQAFVDAQVYTNSAALVRGGQASNLSLSRIDLAALASFVASGRPLGVMADRASDILHVVAILRERGVQPVILGGVEAWKVADELAAADVPVLLDPLMNIPDNYDQLGARLDSAAILHRAGVRVGFMERTGHEVREIRQYAGNAVAWGMPREAALAAITRVPAEIWRVDDRIGRIAPGMAADMVLWTGDPLELTTWADTVIIDGRVVPADSRQLLLQERYRDPRAIYRPPTPGN
ncbi:MAG TPA: amidohydrolase family protein [Pseudomonadales bacterium]|nr:amidohydrolase family protein [Pseudomonadales bacterium]